MLKKFPLRSGTRQGYPLFPFLFNSILCLANRKSQDKEVKQSLFGDDITVYLENNSTGKLLKLMRSIYRNQLYSTYQQK